MTYETFKQTLGQMSNEQLKELLFKFNFDREQTIEILLENYDNHSEELQTLLPKE